MIQLATKNVFKLVILTICFMIIAAEVNEDLPEPNITAEGRAYKNRNNLTNFNASTANRSTVPLGLPFHTVALTVTGYSLIFLIGFFGNALVIFVVCWNKSLQHNTNYCLVNLSVADLLLIVVCMPSAVVDLYAKEVWYFGYIFCKIIPWLEHTIAHASILTIVAISVERSLAIVFPLKAMRMFSSKRLFLVVIIIWIISTLFSLPIMTSTVYSTGYHKQLGKQVNVCYSQFKETWQLIYLFISLFVFYMLPCLLLFFLYGKIVYVIKNRDVKNLTANASESRSLTINRGTASNKYNPSPNETDVILKLDDANSKKSKKNAKLKAKEAKNTPGATNQKQIIILLIIMMFLILLLLLPYRVFSLWTAMATKKQLVNLGINNYYSILNFCRVTFYINSAINPIFYHILSSKFQNAFKNVLRSKGSRSTLKSIHSRIN